MQKAQFFLFFTWFFTVCALSQKDSTASDSLSLEQIKKQISSPPQQETSRTLVSANPNISVIGDFQGRYRTRAQRNFDIDFTEAEFAFQSIVDPYIRADFFPSLAKDQPTGEFHAEVEEAYLTTLELPAKFQLKAGKFKSALGRINILHSHAFPFVSVPNAYRNFFGEEGLSDEGISLSWLVPNPFDFYQELIVECTDGPIENPSFSRSDKNKYLYLAHLKNFWDITENTTLELGFTGIVGPNDSVRSSTIGAIDLTYKWKPLQFNAYKSFVWQTEIYFSNAYFSQEIEERSWGMYSLITYQLDKRWFLTGLFDYSNFPFSSQMVERGYSATLGWYATEFQKIELEVKTTTSNFQEQMRQAALRWIFIIGAHGAHQY